MMLKTLLAILLLNCFSYASEPSFDNSSLHVTTTAGTEVTLPCSVSSLGRNKVAWLGPGKSLVLTMENRRIVLDDRFSVLRNSPNDWSLRFSNPEVDDSGPYKCTVNTQPPRYKTILLTVEAPPNFVEISQGEKRKVIEEGGNVTLSCETSGLPVPHVTWLKVSTNAGSMDEVKDKECRYLTADGSSRVLSKHDNRIEESLGSGESLTIVAITRYCGGEYKCVATNNHPPDQSRLFSVDVVFAPEVSLGNTKLWQYMGKETILQCDVQARPHGMVYWEKNGVKLMNSEKYQIEAYDDVGGSFALCLKFKISEESDFGEYFCKAANVHGEDSAEIQLLEFVQPTREPNHDTESRGVITSKKPMKYILKTTFQSLSLGQNGKVYHEQSIRHRTTRTPSTYSWYTFGERNSASVSRLGLRVALLPSFVIVSLF